MLTNKLSLRLHKDKTLQSPPPIYTIMRNKVRKNTAHTPKSDQDYYEGERLANLLKLLNRELELTKVLERNSLPDKFWFKQQFSIGVNEVTRVLERMLPAAEIGSSGEQKLPTVRLQAVLVAGDCIPKWLTRHLPNLAASRRVPLIFIKDEKGGSLRLGELVKLKTAIAIGVKDRRNAINQVVEEILRGDEPAELTQE